MRVMVGVGGRCEPEALESTDGDCGIHDALMPPLQLGSPSSPAAPLLVRVRVRVPNPNPNPQP